ncbi:helix-turn-helix transcriptional regulator [Actinophytocola sp.]|uniref:helix-turn-helix transcriptional regulator n=1 Tax=Actinophytocola sp. TaxID=1872138 RepID=UPI002ED315D9
MGSAPPAAREAVRTFTKALPPSPMALDVLEGATRALLGVVPADIWCTVLLDPSTLLDTGGQHAYGFPDSVMPRLFEIEHVEQTGVDNLRQLADRGTAASVLSASAKGELDTSVYYRDVLRPLGLSDELRVVLRTGNRVWGLAVMCRSGSSGFSSREAEIARTVARPVSDILRKSLLLAGIDKARVADATGLVILDDDFQIVSMSPTAERWLADLQEIPPGPDRLPNAVRAVATSARNAVGHGQVRSVAHTRSSRWVALEGWRLDGAEGVRTAVAIGPADRTDLAPIILDVYGLTPREREVMQYVLRGYKTARIATRLGVTTDTVQKHIQAVYRKSGAGNRQEFTSSLFFDHYAPQLGAAPLTTDGRLLDQP